MRGPLEAIVYDEPKRRTNLAKHGYDFAELAPEFFEEALSVPAKHDRRIAVGLWKGHLVSVVYRNLGEQAVSVISMRRASNRERQLL